jgi:hypothetical protein
MARAVYERFPAARRRKVFVELFGFALFQGQKKGDRPL